MCAFRKHTMNTKTAISLTVSLATALTLNAHVVAQDGTLVENTPAIAPPMTADATAAATPSPEAAKSMEAAKSDIKYVVAGGFMHFFDADFDTGGGAVAVDRGFGSVSLSGKPSDNYRWGLSINWEGSWYSFADGGELVTAAMGKPWSAVQSLLIAPGATFKLDERWNLKTTLLVQFAGENDADVGDSATFGGIVAASYSFDKDFLLGEGALVMSRLEHDALIVPQILIDWKPCKEFRVTNFAGPEAFPGGAGLEGIWVLSENYELAFGGRFTYRRFRLDDSGSSTRANGVGTDQGLPIWLRATMRADCGARIDLVGGLQVASEMRLDDSAGNELTRVDVEPNPFLGIFMSYRY